MAETYSFTFPPLPSSKEHTWNETMEERSQKNREIYQIHLNELCNALHIAKLRVDDVRFQFSNGIGGLMVNLPGVTAQMISDSRGAKKLGSFIRHDTVQEEQSTQVTETLSEHSNGYVLPFNEDHIRIQETVDV